MGKPQYLIDAEVAYVKIDNDPNATGAQILETADALQDAMIAALEDGYTPDEETNDV